MPAEREGKRKRERDKGDCTRERASERAWYTRAPFRIRLLRCHANSRSVKRRDGGGGDPARHGRPRTSGWQSRPSSGRDKEEQRDLFRRAKRSTVRSARRRRQEGEKEARNRSAVSGEKDAAPRSENLVLRLVLRAPIVLIFKRPKELEEIEEARY